MCDTQSETTVDSFENESISAVIGQMKDEESGALPGAATVPYIQSSIIGGGSSSSAYTSQFLVAVTRA